MSRIRRNGSNQLHAGREAVIGFVEEISCLFASGDDTDCEHGIISCLCGDV